MRQVAVVATWMKPRRRSAKIEFQAIAAGDDGAMQMGQPRELDHGIDDLLAVRNGMRLKHLALPDDGRHATRRDCALAAGR